MAWKKINDNILTDIADEIRNVNGSSDTYQPSEMVNALENIKNDIDAAYDACDAKGATMPVTENSDNLAQTIASIPQGSTPTLITKQITENGTYAAEDDNADGYSEVDVDIDLRIFANNIVNAELNER